jgi:hypothetical protein
VRTTTIYHEDGTKTVVNGGIRKPSYDSQIDRSFHQQVLDNYRTLESEGKLRPGDCPGGKTFVRRLHEEALARE